jgi:multisubunit Na+/H+ antiporter MnhF subunit
MTADDVIPQSTLDTPLAQITGLVVGLIFLAAAIIAIIRIVRGPSILDRMIATDALLATIMCALGGLLAFTGRADLLPVMLVISAHDLPLPQDGARGPPHGIDRHRRGSGTGRAGVPARIRRRG